MTSVLENEVDAFMKQLDEMLANHENMWTVFKYGKALGFWHCPQDALEEGYKSYGNDAFLLRQVSREYKIFGKYGEPLSMGMPSIIGDNGSIIVLL